MYGFTLSLSLSRTKRSKIYFNLVSFTIVCANRLRKHFFIKKNEIYFCRFVKIEKKTKCERNTPFRTSSNSPFCLGHHELFAQPPDNVLLRALTAITVALNFARPLLQAAKQRRRCKTKTRRCARHAG